MNLLKNKKGFTLIELLAVIVILAVLMMLAIPSMTALMENSRKNTYVSTAKSFTNQLRYEALSGIYTLPGVGQYIAIPISKIKLDRGQQKSTFGFDYDGTKSYVIIINDGVAGNSSAASEDSYVYFVAMVDSEGNGFALIEENTLDPADIEKGTAKSKITAYASLGNLTKSSLQGKCSSRTLSYTGTSYTLKKKY